MRSKQWFEHAESSCADAWLLSRHKSPMVFRNVGADDASNERPMLIQIREKFAMAECHRQHAASVRSPEFAHFARKAAMARFLPALPLFVMRCGCPADRANGAAHRNVARP